MVDDSGVRGRAGPVLLYDGICGFCDRTVRLLVWADRRRHFRFAPLQGAFARGVLARNPDLEGVDSLLLVEPAVGSETERVSVRSRALLRLVARLGGPWKLLMVFYVIPRPIRDWAYDVFARHRYGVFGQFDACPVPPPEVRSRFLD